MSSFYGILAAQVSDFLGYDPLEGTDPSELERAPNNIEVDKEFSVRQDIESHMKKIVVLDDGEVCSVCLQDINVGDENTRVLKCSHIFHHRCMSEWSKRKPNCPLCRHDVRTDRQPNLKRKRLLHEAQELKDETSSTHCQRKT
ncbi:hypothetical protein MKW98_019665 [Papaver atlanticum]|uniref:RING-type E3 ubiquitin transferase n=1 Tax=Papaver atlanticum TaxID=357466 RepID=A0AAD4XBM0_9MAGN|nr:hypothetical protein MKW98_019665 [Papaver atlanticum]